MPSEAEERHREHFEALRRIVLSGARTAATSPAARVKARSILLDTLACVMSGRQSPELQAFERHLAHTEPGEFRFPGGPALSLSAASALAANASAWDEACEGLPYAHGRPALSLIGALWPLAIRRGDSLDGLLDALIAGYEAGGRAGGWLRIRPGMHVDGNWPALGVAAGAGLLLGLSADERWQAVSSVACQLPASLYAPIRSGDDARNLYPGHCAWLGLMAVHGARSGIRAPDTVLLEVAREHARADGRLAPPDSRIMLLETYFKPHAGVRHAHYGLEAAIRIREAISNQTGSIDAIHLKIYEEAVRYAGNRDPRAAITGQFSLSLGVAAGLRFGEMSPQLFRSEQFHDPELRRLEHLITIEPDPHTRGDQGRTATLTVHAGDTIHEASINSLAGDPSRPPTPEQMLDKFVRYSAGVVAAPRSAAFANAILLGDGKARLYDLWNALC